MLSDGTFIISHVLWVVHFDYLVIINPRIMITKVTP